IEAQGLLIKAVYKKYGKDVLPLIRDVLNRQGKALGLKIMRKLPNNNLSTIASAFSKSFDPAFVKVISLSDEKFHIQGTKCPFGLENTTRELCEAVMEIDREYFYTATNGRTKLEILKTVAEGDSLCDTIYTIIKPED
ncbi:MAG: L-2-amino-thiazoline-4-carboxylic acid hydrolase, partial [Candidatus Helarchaeota archaeon]